MLKKIFFLTLAAVLHLPDLCAQIRMESLSVADGLSQGFATSMIQDRQGFIWIGTFDGLNRYDGYNIRHFSPKPFDAWSLHSSYITSLYECPQGFIWVGTHEGLYVFDPLKERFFYLSQPTYGLPANYVNEITGDAHSNLFVQVTLHSGQNGIFRLVLPQDFAQKISTASASLAGVEAQPILADPRFQGRTSMLGCIGDTMLLAVDKTKRVFRYSFADHIFRPFDLRNLPSSPSADHSILWSKYCGYFFRRRLPDGRDSILPLPGNLALRLGNGEIGAWIYQRGPLLRKNANTPLSADLNPAPPDQPLRQADFQEEFTQILERRMLWSGKIMTDGRGTVWLGTGGWGIKKANLRQLSFTGLLAGSSISTLREISDRQIWVRLYSDQSFVINSSTFQIEPAPWEMSRHRMWVYEVRADREGNFWLVEPWTAANWERRLVFYEKNTGRTTRFPEQLPFEEGVPEKIFEDREGNIWVAAHRGLLLRCRPGQRSLEHFSYQQFVSAEKRPNLRATAIVQDDGGTIWIGTNRGLLRMDQSNSAAPQFSFLKHDPNDPQTISNDWVACICPDPADRNAIWLGTRGGGLNRLDVAARTFSFLTEAPNGLPDNVVYGILPDGLGNLWCSTNHGLCRFNPAQQTFVTYQESDGLLSTEFNTNAYLRSRDGRLWFGGVSGLNVFRPEDIQPMSPPPPVAITGIKVRGTLRLPDAAGHLSLPFGENNVLFEFAVLDFANPATNRFRHRLKGIDQDWVYDGTSHSANYAALPPGSYVFELQGATAHGSWNGQSVTFALTIRPPWYRSWLAWLVYVLVAAAAVLGYVRYREKMFRLSHSAAANQRETERLKEFDRVKNQFFTNIAHELRTPLTVILGLAHRLWRGAAGDSVSQNAQNIIQQGTQLLELSNQVLDLAKLESQQFVLSLSNGDINEFVRQHTEPLAQLAASKGIRLHMDGDAAEKIGMDFDPSQLQKILNNLISNAIRHTPPGGAIRVKTNRTAGGDHLQLSVADNGEGIAPEDLPHIFDRFYQGSQPARQVGASGIGLTLVRDLVHLMGGSISVESPAPDTGKGSLFSILLPISNHAPRMAEVQVLAPMFVPPPPAPPSTDGRPLPLLLVIEDNTAVLDYLHLCLQPHFRLATATDGTASIEKALHLMPDLILTDVALPGKDGFELAFILKNDVRTSHIPIVMLTAKTESADRVEGHRRGASAYLTKPFEEQELLLVLHNLLHLQQQWKHRYAPPSQEQTSRPALLGHAPEDLRMEDEFMQKLYAVFEANYPEEGFHLDRLCQLMGMSSSQLDRKLKVLTDQSPMQMLRSFRLQKARALLQTTPGLNIKEVCFRTGFKNPSHFSRAFSEEFGAPPSEWKE